MSKLQLCELVVSGTNTSARTIDWFETWAEVNAIRRGMKAAGKKAAVYDRAGNFICGS